MAGTGVDQTRGQLAAEGMIQAGLVATDAGVDFVRAVFGRLQNKVRIRQERTGHGYHISIAFREDLLGNIRHVDAVGGHQGDADLVFQARRYLGKRAPRHRGSNGRYTGFMPADAGVDNGGAGFLDFFRQLHHFIPGTAIFDKIQHRQTVNKDEIAAHALANPANNLDRQSNAVLVAATPLVSTMVCMGHDELVDEVTFRTHDLHAVVPGFPRERRAVDVILNLLFDTRFVQLSRLHRVDGCLNRGRGHQLRMISVATGMENLHTDLAVGLMHRAGDHLMLVRFFLGVHLGRVLEHRTFHIRGNTTSHNQTRTATGTFGVESGKPIKTILRLFQASMHGPHQCTIAKTREPEIQRLQQIGVTFNARCRFGHDLSPVIGSAMP